MEKRIGIYRIRNIENGKFYIGSSNNIFKRWMKHKSELNLNKHHSLILQNAWNKYGEKSFIFEILKEVNELDLLNEEQKELDKFDLKTQTYNIESIAGKPPIKKGEESVRAKLNWDIVQNIRQKYQNKEKSIKELCEEYFVCKRTMALLIHNETWIDNEYIVPSDDLKKRNYGNKGKTRKSKEQFINECIQKYGNKFDYSKVEYVNNITPVIVICKKHGDFLIRPNGHLGNNRGCPKCGYETMIFKRKYSFEEMIKQANVVHGKTQYTYPNQDIDSRKKLSIICNSCNTIFQQRMNSHLQGQGCPKCNKKGSKFGFHSLKSFCQNFNFTLNQLEKQCYLIDNTLKINFIEIIQTNEFPIDGIFHIFSDEWRYKKEIIQSMIFSRLGKNKTIFARNCKIQEIEFKEGKKFFENNHLAGDNRAQKYFALMLNEQIVCCLSFKKPIQKAYGNVIEIARFANILNHTVIGGFQKLLCYTENWIKQEKYDGILTYADLRIGTGNVYQKAGFELMGRTTPDYWYSNGIIRENRFKYRAQNGKSEKEVALENKVFKIYGCGSNIYLKRFEIG